VKSILIIEDNKSLREDIYESLKYEGFEVFQTDNGKSGIKYALSHHPDLILCDIMMPEMNGFEVLEKLRQNERASIIPFIFITSLADRNNFRTGMEMGADDYITKPFTLKELITAINTRLDKYYNKQLGSVIDNIDSKLSSKLKSLKQQVSIQQAHISKISGTNTLLKEQLEVRESELYEEVFKSIEIGNTLTLLKSQLEKELMRSDITDVHKTLLNDYLNKIERISNKKNPLRIFQLRFNQANPDFIASITVRFPNLTQLELTLISALLFNLGTSQIVNMLNISPDSVRKSKYRLKKKLKLNKDVNLIEFIRSFSRRM
jgi:DNA-binding response OmpR family regulator/DNA-binding CsgD family transcriptional regulator